MKSSEATEADRAVMDGFKAVLGKQGADLEADRLLAIAAQFLGNLIALQDKRRYTADEAMDLVRRNIEIGNQEAVNVFGPDAHGPAGHA